MADYISREALYNKTAEWEAQALHMVETTMHDEDNAEWKRWSTILTERSAFKHDVADAHTIDAVPVVRCADCKYLNEDLAVGEWDGSCRYWNTHSVLYSWFCSQGERKDGAE